MSGELPCAPFAAQVNYIFQICSISFIVTSLSISPVFNMSWGSNKAAHISFSVMGLCSTPLGIEKI